MKKQTGLFIFIILLCALLAGCSLIGEKAEPFSEEEFIAAIEQAAAEKKTELIFAYETSDTLETRMDDALTKAYSRYIVGENILNISWTAKTALLSTSVSLELEYSDDYTDERASAYAYTEKTFTEMLEQAILGRRETLTMLLFNDGTITDTGLEAEINRILFSGENAVMTYYLSSTQYSVTTYDEYLVLDLTLEYIEDTPFGSIPQPADPLDAIKETLRQWETDNSAILYLPEAPADPEAYCNMIVTTAIANDADFCYNSDTYYWNAYGTRDSIITLNRKCEYDESELRRMREEITAEAQKIAAEVTSTEPKETVKEIAGLICNRVSYDDPLANSILSEHGLSHESNIRRTAYGALIDGTSVCTGYAKAFQLVCDFAGIECWTIDGTVDEVGHEWNAVFIDGEKYYVDLTFADTGRKDKAFYLFDDGLFREQGYIIDEGFYIPAA
ncbi:MAG: hypothetical protein IKK29_00095 [Christensenellaceae bacterium]|nr:hypothetical protein [Christensenellaceae bacterium]